MNDLNHWDANGSPVLDIEILDEQIIERTEPTHAEQVGYLVNEMAKMPQVTCPLQHHFAPGIYLREIFMPADTYVIGRIHKTEHFNILVKGACRIVHGDGTQEELRAPMVFVSKAGVQKLLHITEDMIWMTTHPGDETDLNKLDAMLVEPASVQLLENAS